MIKFFRNIRRKLTAENKAASYLRNPIGEVVLIVIGISIKSDLGVIQLCYESGFKNNSNFVKSFKEKFDIVQYQFKTENYSNN